MNIDQLLTSPQYPINGVHCCCKFIMNIVCK